MPPASWGLRAMQSPVSPCSCCSSHGAEEQLVPGPCQYVRCCAIHTRSQHTMYHGTTAGAAGIVRLQPDPVHVRHRCRHTGTRAEVRRARSMRHESDNAVQQAKTPRVTRVSVSMGTQSHQRLPAQGERSHGRCRQKKNAGEIRTRALLNFAAGGVKMRVKLGHVEPQAGFPR